jgi:hypothetical protein
LSVEEVAAARERIRVLVLVAMEGVTEPAVVMETLQPPTAVEVAVVVKIPAVLVAMVDLVLLSSLSQQEQALPFLPV